MPVFGVAMLRLFNLAALRIERNCAIKSQQAGSDMDFALSEQQLAFQKTARDFAHKELAPHADKWDAQEEFPRAALRALAQLGFAGMAVAPQYGGSGLSRQDAALIFEALAGGCPSTAAFLSIHNMASWMVDAFGSDALRAQLVPDLCRMDKIASYCLTEPDAGSDAASLRTRAVRDGAQYIVNGSKSFISGAGVSDLYVTMLRTGGPGAGGISCLVIARDAPGLRFGKPEKKLGWRNQPTAQVIFEDCRVPAAHLLGREGEGFKIAMRGLDGGRINIAACSLGAAAEALAKAKAYAGERKQFGQPLASLQAIQFKLADMATDLCAARLMIWQAARALDEGAPAQTSLAAMAKRFATDAGFRIVNEALQIHGGYGYLRDYGLERLLRDVRVHQILEGTNEIMRLIIARALLSANAPM